MIANQKGMKRTKVLYRQEVAHVHQGLGRSTVDQRAHQNRIREEAGLSQVHIPDQEGIEVLNQVLIEVVPTVGQDQGLAQGIEGPVLDLMIEVTEVSILDVTLGIGVLITDPGFKIIQEIIRIGAMAIEWVVTVIIEEDIIIIEIMETEITAEVLEEVDVEEGEVVAQGTSSIEEIIGITRDMTEVDRGQMMIGMIAPCAKLMQLRSELTR